MKVSLNYAQRAIMFTAMNISKCSVSEVLTKAFSLLEQQLQKETSIETEREEMPSLQGGIHS